MSAAKNARARLHALGGERIHPKYARGAAEDMMAAVKMHRPASEQDFADVHALAVAEMGPGLASLSEIMRVDSLTGAAIWVVRRKGEITGFLAPLALTQAGVDALVDNTFTAGNIDRSWVQQVGGPIAGWYCWCYAGRDQVSRGALVLGLRTLIDVHFHDMPFFGRDSTEAGARIMRHLGFHPFDDTPHLYWRCCDIMEPSL